MFMKRLFVGVHRRGGSGEAVLSLLTQGEPKMRQQWEGVLWKPR